MSDKKNDVNTENNAVDRVLDLFIEEAAIIASERIGAAYPEPEGVEISPELDQRMEQVLNKIGRRYTMRKIATFTRKAAVVLLVMIAVSALMVFSVEAWRVEFLNLFVTETPVNSFITFEKGTSYHDENISIGYIPEGYEITINNSSAGNVYLLFQNGESYFDLSRGLISSNISIDTEDASVKRIDINGYEGYYSIKGQDSIMVWGYSSYSYMLAGDIGEPLLLEIAKSIK